MITLKINFSTHALSVQYYPQKNVKNSVLGVSHVPLDQEDIFSLQTFKEIQEERFAHHMDLYICVVKENDHFFFFEGSRFIEAFLKEGKKFKNPMTRNDIDNFEIIFSHKENPTFQHYKQKKEIEVYPYYLPILWNDYTRPVEERADYLDRMGECYYFGKGVEQSIDLAIYFYEKSAKIGRLESHVELSRIFYDKMHYRKSNYWLIKFLNSNSSKIIVQHLLCAGDVFRTGDEVDANIYHAAFYYTKSALFGNYYGIANIISIYEGNTPLRNTYKAFLWRKHLPQAWQSKKIIEVFQHLKDEKYDRNQVRDLSFSSEILQNNAELQPPDADALFPEIKQDLERRITPENLYHFSLEEIQIIKQGVETQISSEGYKADSELNHWTKV